MKSFPAENGEQKPQNEKGETGRRQWIIFLLFVLAVLSISVFFVLRVVLERAP